MPRMFLHYSLAAVAVFTMFLLPMPIAHAQKEQFVRSKPHVNVGTAQLRNATGATKGTDMRPWTTTHDSNRSVGRNHGYVQHSKPGAAGAKTQQYSVQVGWWGRSQPKEKFVRSKPQVNAHPIRDYALSADNQRSAKAKVNAIKSTEIPELKPSQRRIDLKASSLYGLAAPNGKEPRSIKTRSHSGQRSGGDADLRVRVGADPTITSPGLLGNAAGGFTSQGPGGTGAPTSNPGANSIRAR
jgi:hypothetical protein